MNFVTNKIEPTSQKLRGGYYTPVALARYLCEWALRDGQEKVLEPSVGDGNFLAALNEAAGKSGGVRVTAVELDSGEFAKARARAAEMRSIDVTWRNEDFFAAYRKLPRDFDVVVGNPPYITVKDKATGEERRIDCACKVWAAGVEASPLGKILVDQVEGAEIDRCGRVVVEPDLTLKGHPNVFVVGDMALVPKVPGVAQGAIQGAAYVAKIVKRSVKGLDAPEARVPFKYFDKGSMATISRHHAVAKVGKLEFGGYPAWLAWLVLHLLYLVGFKNRVATLFSWINTFTSHSRGQLTTTSQMVYARLALEAMDKQLQHEVDAAERRSEQLGLS